ncbi:MAG: hypothetical protein EAZ76_12595 [Nostocales cyanobacterium]|nr:MAG: hypothetical protein EAZ87_16150 [Nostocales cyanobacterium]TAF13043.1 MAG: hypothetical protein EAZ76_12595 [Nostocales cyanobacterium]
MNTEQILLEKWRILPLEKQEQVLKFVDYLTQTNPDQQSLSAHQPRTSLGEKLLAIREKIMLEQAPITSWEDLEQEISARRGEQD